jgi:choline dehydrogenase-like flavoprotein
MGNGGEIKQHCLKGESMAKQEIFDAVVVGSGATGGWAAKELTQKGLRVAVVEAGRKLDPLKDYREHTWPYELKYRGFGDRQAMRTTQPIQSKCYACNEYGSHLFVKEPLHHACGQTVPLDSLAARRGSLYPVGPSDLQAF